MENEKSVFDLRLNETGRHWLLRICSVIRILLFITITSTAIHLAYLLRFEIRSAIKMNMRVWTLFREWPHVPVQLFSLVTGLVSIYYLFLFRKKTRQAVLAYNADELNRSFESLWRFLAISILNTVLLAGVTLFYVLR